MGKIETKSMCQQAMIYYYDCLSEAKTSIPAEILAHIEHCDHCQQELLWLQETDSETNTPSGKNAVVAAQASHLNLHFALTGQPVSCSTIRTFLPAMAIPGQQVTIPTPVTAHISHCRLCAQELAALRQMGLTTAQYGDICRIFSGHQSHFLLSFSGQQLKTIDLMRSRPDSGIVTCFRIRNDSQVGQEACFDIEVSPSPASFVRNTEPKQTATDNSASLTPRKNIRLQPKRFFRPVAAAAVVLIGALLLFKSPSVQATDISQIYEALKDVKNILMTQYGEDSAAPLQQTWVCKDLGVKLFKTNNQTTLWDLNRQVKQTLTDIASPAQSTPLDTAAIEAVSGTMNIPWGLLPFKNTRDLPQDAIWKKIESDQHNAAVESVEVYDLSWTEKTITGDVQHQWRFHIDAATKHPQKVQSWKKTQPDKEYEPIILIEITYPTTEQIQDMLKQFGY